MSIVPGSRTAEALRALTLTLIPAMIMLVMAWTLAPAASKTRLAWAIPLTLPLWAPVYGILRRNRRTYAWATLCVIPYFVLALTEAIANPQDRGWSASCLALALLLFSGLIGYLRVTRPG